MVYLRKRNLFAYENWVFDFFLQDYNIHIYILYDCCVVEKPVLNDDLNLVLMICLSMI